MCWNGRSTVIHLKEHLGACGEMKKEIPCVFIATEKCVDGLAERADFLLRALRNFYKVVLLF